MTRTTGSSPSVLKACAGAAILAMAALAGCAGTASTIQVRADAVVPKSQSVAYVLDASHNLARLLGELSAKCLDAKGFPEAGQALAKESVRPISYQSKPLELILIDMGPSTMAEADDWGFGGASFPLSVETGAIVISRNPQFDKATEQCRDAINHEYPEFSELLNAGAELNSRVRTHFVSNLRGLREALSDRFTCVRRHGYPSLETTAALNAPDLVSILHQAGVEPGRETTSYSAPTRADVEPGDVEVFQAPPPRTYSVSASEQEFSRQYVRCAELTDFEMRVELSVRHARAATERKYSGQASALAVRLEQLAEDVRTGARPS